MTKKIVTVLGILSLIGFVACQRQASTKGTFFKNMRLQGPVLQDPDFRHSQFNFIVDTVTKKGHAEFIIYEEDKITINKKYSFNFTLGQISQETKGNDVIHKVEVVSVEDPTILAQITITDTPDYRDKGSSIETWMVTKSKVTLFKIDPEASAMVANSEHALDKVIGEHEGRSEKLESSNPKMSPDSIDRIPRRFDQYDPRKPQK